MLRLGASTGLKNKNLRKPDLFYNLSESESATVQCFLHGKTAVLCDNEALVHNGKADEYVGGPVAGRAYIPIFTPNSVPGSNHRVIGVIRVVNKIVSLGGHKESLGFGDDDIELLQFLSSFIGVVASLFGKIVRASEDLERALHGVQNNLFGVQSRLLQLVERKAFTLVDDRFGYHIPDAIEHLQGLSWQLERFVSGNRSYEHKKTLLLGEVLSLLPNAFPVLAKCFSREINSTSLPNFSVQFRDAPAVRADPQALLMVFRNLLENSIKYSHPKKPIEICMSWNDVVRPKYLTIYYSDNGIGVDSKDAPYIFNEGYKSEAAMRRCTLGAGLGLAQCLEVMREMHGAISLQSNSEPTTFEISIPLWEEQT
jgi:signal transduction histidine kinase